MTTQNGPNVPILCGHISLNLSAYALLIDVTYKTGFRWWKVGKLDASQLDTGTVVARDPLPRSAKGVALYARVSSVDQQGDLERQMERLKDDAVANSYKVRRMVQEIIAVLNEMTAALSS